MKNQMLLDFLLDLFLKVNGKIIVEVEKELYLFTKIENLISQY